MHKTGLNYYDLLQSAGITASSFQAFIDGYFANKYNTAMWDGFTFDTAPMIDYTYEDFQKELQMNVMATYVNPDSPAKAKSTEGFSKLSGTIPTMKDALVRDAKEVRDLMKMQMVSGNAVQNEAIASLYRKMDQLLGTHVNSITYQRNQMMSRGKLELLDTNNPGGIQNITYSAQIPSANIVTKTGTAKWWTDSTRATEGSTSDPIADLEAQIEALEALGVKSMQFEVDKLTLKAVLKHSKVLTAIGYNLAPLAASADAATNIGLNLSFEQRKAALEAVIGCPIKVIDCISAVEKFNKTTMKPEVVQMRSFQDNVFTLAPTGSVGTIKHVMPILPPEGYVGALAQYFNNSLLMRVTSDIKTNLQTFDTEQAVLAVINKPKYIRILNVL